MPSIVSPSRSVTTAFFQLGRRPADLPTRRTLPRWFDVHTPVTFTPNSCSIAWRIAGFDASGATSNTYSPRSCRAMDVFSVTIGRTMVRYRVAMTYRSFFLGAFFAALFLAADFFAADLVAAFAARFAVFFAADFFAAGFFAAAFFFAAVLRPLTAGVAAGVARRGGSGSGSSLIGGSACPMAPPSISTTSDQRIWYVETSLYGMTCTLGRLRPDRNTFGFTPSVRTSTFCSPTPMRLTSL